jgi:uncharacterized protein YdhG (YjbR/CyaY superfamily)
MSFSTVTEYIDSLGDKKQYFLDFVSFMKAEFPNITPKISYAMPVWWAGEKIYEGYMGISAAKAHYTIHFGEEAVIEKLKAALPDSKFGKRCVHVKYKDESALPIVRQYVKEYFSSVVK